MVNKKNIVEFDVIGGQGSLTIAEEQALSNYFKKAKLKIAEKAKKRRFTTSKRMLVKA